MKFFKTTTALVALAALPAFAQDQSDGDASASGESEMASSGEASQGSEGYGFENALTASSLMGHTVYAVDGGIDPAGEFTEAGDDWQSIGEIGDLVVSTDGALEAVVLDIGGFLGMGEQRVALSLDDLNIVNDVDGQGNFFVVVSQSKEALEGLPTFSDESVGQWMAATMDAGEQAAEDAAEETADAAEEAGEEVTEAGEDAAQAAENAAEETADAAGAAAENVEEAADEAGQEMAEAGEDAAQAAESAAEETADAAASAAENVEEAADEAGEEMAEAAEDAEQAVDGETDTASADGSDSPSVDREGFSRTAAGDIEVTELTGARVYDTDDAWIGEVSDVLMSDSGQAESAVLDIGGFLGFGEKSVAMSFDSLNIQTANEGGEIRVYVDASKSELEEMENYEPQQN